MGGHYEQSNMPFQLNLTNIQRELLALIGRNFRVISPVSLTWRIEENGQRNDLKVTSKVWLDFNFRQKPTPFCPDHPEPALASKTLTSSYRSKALK